MKNDCYAKAIKKATFSRDIVSKNLKDEAFYLRKKKVSCGHFPCRDSFFTKAEP